MVKIVSGRPLYQLPDRGRVPALIKLCTCAVALAARSSKTDRRVTPEGHRFPHAIEGVIPLPQFGAVRPHQRVKPMAVGKLAGLVAGFCRADFCVAQHSHRRTTFSKRRDHESNPRHEWRRMDRYGRLRPLSVDFEEKTSIRVDCCAPLWRGKWRRGRDSNPGYPHEYAAFRVRCIRPLCHLSAEVLDETARASSRSGAAL